VAVADGKRAYRSEVREQQAARTRHLVLDAAAEEFAARGWGGTTMARIAERAGVSVESVYGIGTKGLVLLEAFRLRYTGESGWASVLEQRVIIDILAIDDAGPGMDAVVDFLVTAHGRSARLWMVMRTAAGLDPALDEGLAELSRLRTESFRVTTDWMVRVGLCEPVATPEEHESLTAWLSIAMSAETYVQLVDDWGFTPEQYAGWVRRTLPTLRP
jgi:AcrR family transcriptional regulator